MTICFVIGRKIKIDFIIFIYMIKPENNEKIQFSKYVYINCTILFISKMISNLIIKIIIFIIIV